VREAGIRQITYDRPGFGWSTPDPGRSVASVVKDITQLLDALGLDRVAVAGTSGGGPHALAIAALAPDRCTHVRCIVSVAPFDAEGLDFYQGLDPENVERFQIARKGRDLAEGPLAADLAASVARAASDPLTLFGTMNVPDSDRAVMARIAPHIAAGHIESARQGAAGYIDDLVAFTTPWGFDVADVSAPLVIEYGDKDVHVPAAHGAWLARHIPQAEVRVTSGAGHLSHPDDGLARLVDVARA
jgi:pimeloyl-ACP methyl ester carboxylesterase